MTSKRVDPRIAHTRQVVLTATVAELTEVGFERVSIDAIAERSGVARSTIYRNWSDRETLLAEAFGLICSSDPGDIPGTDDLRLDLENLGKLLATQLAGDEWKRTVPSLISAAMHDEPMGELLASFAAERRAEARPILTRALERGEIPDSDRFDEVMERFVAPFFYRRLLSRRPLDADFIASQVDAAIGELKPLNESGGRTRPG